MKLAEIIKEYCVGVAFCKVKLEFLGDSTQRNVTSFWGIMLVARDKQYSASPSPQQLKIAKR